MPTFCFRLVFRFNRAIGSDLGETSLRTELCPHPLKLKARTGTLRTTHGLAIESCGYSSEEEARLFGSRILNAMLIGGIVRRVGVDFGIGKRRAQYSNAVKQAVAKTGATLREEVDGLDVYADEQVVFIATAGHIVAWADVEDINNLINSQEHYAKDFSEPQKIAAGLLNDSLFEVSTDAAFILRISAVEALCPQATASPEYISLASALRDSIPATISEDTRQAMVRLLQRDALRQSVRSAYMSKFRRLLGAQKANQFDKLYSQRSKFLHEGLHRGRLLDAANAALDLAQELLLSDIESGA